MKMQFINRIKVLYSYLMRSSYNYGRPIEVVIEPTNHCNMRCPMCIRSQDDRGAKRDLGFMSMPVFQKAIDEVSGYAESVDLYLAGEPLLHPNIIDMINYCGEKGVSSIIHTNGSFLTEEKSRAIVNSPLSLLEISLDGATKETYEQIRVGGKYDDIVNNIETYLKIKNTSKHPGPYTILQMIYMESNKKEAELFRKQWRRKGVDEVRIKAFNTTGLSEANAKLGLGSCSDKKPIKKTKAPCFLLWRFFVVHWDGVAVACCVDFNKRYPLGNITEKSLEELWNGPLIRKLRSLHINDQSQSISLCQSCSMPELSVPMHMASIFVNNTTIKKKLLPYIESLWLLKGIKKLKYFNAE